MATDIPGQTRDGREDFDFLIGTWKIRHRRLRERLKGSQSWDECDGTCVAQKVLGELGNLDEITIQRESGVSRGMTLRLFNPETQQWSIHWADSSGSGLQERMVGEFKNGRGEFYDCEPFEGKRIFCRFIWQSLSPTACRWEQAFSADGGASWETNWIMDFTRESL